MQTIVVYHLREDAPRAGRAVVTEQAGPVHLAADTARTMLTLGNYEPVATMTASGMDSVYAQTQNREGSWSLDATEGLTVFQPRGVTCNGRLYGRRSTSMGDVLEADGRLYMVARFGFCAIEAE